MVAGAQRAEDGGGNRGHAGRRGARVLRAFQRAHALLEHVDGRVGVARIDEAGRLALEARLGGLGGFVDVALRQVDRFRRLAMLGAQRAAVDKLSLPASSSRIVRHGHPSKNKKTGREVATGPLALQPTVL